MLIEKDKRLMAKISMESGDRNMPEIVKILNKKTIAKLFTLNDMACNIGMKDAYIYSAMDALSALQENRWRKSKDGYEFIKTFYSGIQGFNDSRNEARNTEALRFIDDFNKLPSLLQKKFSDEEGALLSEMPESMYKPILNILNTQISKASETLKPGESLDNGIEDAKRDKIRVTLKKEDGDENLYQYRMGYVAPGFSSSFSVSDFERKVAEHEKVKFATNSNPNHDIYESINFEFPKSAYRTIRELQKIVSVSERKATLVDVMSKLNKEYNINYVVDCKDLFPQTANVRFQNVPLHRAMDILTRVYADTEWEWRKLGFIVVRAPYNPARVRRYSGSGRVGSN
jgi:hypothetical protein